MKNQETFHQTLAMMTVGLNEFAVAIDEGWLSTSNTTPTINKELLLTWPQIEWTYFLDKYICRIFGLVMAAILLDKVGRKTLLLICAITFSLSWLIILLSKSVEIFYLARFAFGIASGINDVTNAVYLGENSSPSVRGIFGAIIKSIYSLGYLFGIITAIFFHFRTAALINLFITLLSLISVFWMVEPVQYQLMKGKYDQAEKNFIWLKGVTNLDNVADEFQEIKQNVNAEISKKSSFIKIFTYPANYKSLLIMLIISSLVGFINHDSVALVELLYLPNTDSSTWNNIVILLGVTQFLVMALPPFIIRRFNRRSMMIISFSLISITLFLIAALIFIQNTNVLPRNFLSISIRISILFFNSVYVFAFTLLFLLRSELFPLSMKAIGGSVSIIGSTLGGFLSTEIVSIVIEHFYFYCIFLAGIGVILVLFLYYTLPETENISLVEIQEKLESEN